MAIVVETRLPHASQLQSTIARVCRSRDHSHGQTITRDDATPDPRVIPPLERVTSRTRATTRSAAHWMWTAPSSEAPTGPNGLCDPAHQKGLSG